MNLGEVAGVARQFEGPHLHLPPRRPHAAASSSTTTASSSARSARTSTASTSRTSSASTRTTTSGAWTKASNMVIKFNPEGHVTMLLGRKWEAARGPARAAAGRRRRRRARASTTSTGRPTSRGTPAGNIFVERRLQQLARREVRQERQLGQGVGRARQRAGTVQHPAHDRDRRHGQHLRRRPDQPAHPGVRRRGRRFSGSSTTSSQPWAICITPGPTQVLYSSDANSGKIFKLDLNGTLLGSVRVVRQAAQAVRVDSRDRVSVRKRAVRRRAAELAHAEAPAAPAQVADWTNDWLCDTKYERAAPRARPRDSTPCPSGRHRRARACRPNPRQ